MKKFWGKRVQPHGRDVGSIRRVQAHTLGCDLKDSQITLENHLSRERHPNLTLLKKKKKNPKYPIKAQ